MPSKQAVLISIHKEHADRILDGSKTLEIRKSAPAGIAFPYIIYMYETKSTGSGLVVGNFLCLGHIKTNVFSGTEMLKAQNLSDVMDVVEQRKYIIKRSCLTVAELMAYAKGGNICALNVTAPVRYQHPRQLSQLGISRPPQSWCYVVKTT